VHKILVLIYTTSLRVAGSYNSYLEVARDHVGDGVEELLAIYLGVSAADSAVSQWPRMETMSSSFVPHPAEQHATD
jgi:microcompartment protein CcmK/EutM